jgi:hypothetical protein
MKHPIRSLILGAALAVALNVTPAKAVVVQTNSGWPNVVGIIYQAYANGAGLLIGPPFGASPNDLNTLLPSATTPVGTKVGRFVPSIGDYYYSTNTISGWSSNIVFNFGEGFYLLPSADFTNAWCGEVREGYWTNTITTGGGFWNLVSLPFPLGGNLNTNVMQGYPIYGGGYDKALPFNVAGQDWPTSYGIFYPRGGHSNTWYMNYMIRPGESFLVSRGTNATPFTANWVSYFSVDGLANYTPPNSWDLYVSIDSATSAQVGSSLVTTSTVTIHNTQPGDMYELDCSTNIDATNGPITWTRFAVMQDQGNHSVSAVVVWTNSPNPSAAAWTNSNYGNTLATNVPYTNIGMPSLYIRARDPGPADGYYWVKTIPTNNFEPWVNGAPYTNALCVQSNTGQGYEIYEVAPRNGPIWSLNFGFNGEDFWPYGNYDGPGYHLIPGQGVLEIYGLSSRNNTNLAQLLISHNPIAYLDLSACEFSLTNVEAYASSLKTLYCHDNNIKRICLESNQLDGCWLAWMDPLFDLRLGPQLGNNGLTNMTLPFLHYWGGNDVIAPCTNLKHLCIRDNPNLRPDYLSSWPMPWAIPVLRELIAWNCGQTGVVNLTYTTNLSYVDLRDNHGITDIQFHGCTNLHYFRASNCNLSAIAMENILGEIWAYSTNALKNPDGNLGTESQIELSGNGPTTPLGYYYFTNLQAIIGSGNGKSCTIDWPPLCYGDSGSTTQEVTFVTFARAGTTVTNKMRIDLNSSTLVTWHWGDTNVTDTNSSTLQNIDHIFQAAPSGRDVYYTNYVRVNNPSQVRRFGTQQDSGDSHVVGAYSVSNFTALNKLYFYEDSLSDLSLAGCPSTLIQLHLARTAVRNCDQWFADTVVNCPGNQTPDTADFYYPPNAVTDASSTNRATLTGWNWDVIGAY